MGRLRGQRNAAREKAWPGQDAADVRAEKHGDVAQRIEHEASDLGVAGSSPAVPAMPQGWIPTTEAQKRAARAKAEGTETRWTPPRRIPTISKGARLRSKITSKTWEELLGDQHWNKVGRVHYLLTLLKAKQRLTERPVIASYLHELDPMEVMIMAEEMDLEKMTVQNFWELIGEAA